jgi:hypothetical protein
MGPTRRRGAARTATLLALVALALASCGQAPDADAPDGTVHRDAIVDPSRLVVDADRAAPGSLLQVSFPGGMTRGPGFTIDRRVDERWVWRYVVSSDTDDPLPTARAVDPTVQLEWNSGPAFDGPRPHRIPIPEDADDGRYRICTAPDPVVCVEVEVDREAPRVLPTPAVTDVVTLTAGPVVLVAHAPGTDAPAGEGHVDGTLAWDDDRGCFTLQGWQVGVPVVWPVGTGIVPTDPPQVQLADGTTLRVGDDVTGRGVYEVPERVPAELPPRCRGEVAVFAPDATVQVLPPVEE